MSNIVLAWFAMQANGPASQPGLEAGAVEIMDNLALANEKQQRRTEAGKE